MDDFRTPLRLVIATLATFWADLGPFIQALLILQAVDIAAGLVQAGWTGQLDSRVTYRGLLRKSLVLLLVAAAALLGAAGGIPGLAQAVAGFYVAHEVLSIAEHAKAVGIPVPGILQEVLKRLPGQEIVDARNRSRDSHTRVE